MAFIFDLSTLPTHIRYASRNIRDFKITFAEYKARKEAKKNGGQLRTNNEPPAVPAPNTSRGGRKSKSNKSIKGAPGGPKSKSTNGNAKNKNPIQRNGVTTNASFDNLGMISEESPVRSRNDLMDRNRRNNFNISPAYNSGYGNHFSVDANINHFDSPYHHHNHHLPRTYGSPYDAYDDYGTPGRDAQTMTQY